MELAQYRAQRKRQRRGGRAQDLSERLTMAAQIPSGVGSIQDTTPCTSSAGLGTPRSPLLEASLETLGAPFPDPNKLLSELGLDPQGLDTNVLVSQRDLMMRSLLDGSIPPPPPNKGLRFNAIKVFQIKIYKIMRPVVL